MLCITTPAMSYYGARWYDPYLNRWTSPDSIIPEELQGTQAWDRYAYSNNNPVNFNDPSGHFIQAAPAAAIGAIVGLGLYALNTYSSGQKFELTQAATVMAVGAVSGALISTGIGAVAAIDLFAGIGMGASAGGSLLANTVTHSEFNTANFLISSATGFVNGASVHLLELRWQGLLF